MSSHSTHVLKVRSFPPVASPGRVPGPVRAVGGDLELRAGVGHLLAAGEQGSLRDLPSALSVQGRATRLGIEAGDLCTYAWHGLTETASVARLTAERGYERVLT